MVALLALKNVRQFLQRQHVQRVLKLASPEDRDALGLVLESVGEAMAMLRDGCGAVPQADGADQEKEQEA
jgi:hypothetical protein